MHGAPFWQVAERAEYEDLLLVRAWQGDRGELLALAGRLEVKSADSLFSSNAGLL